MTTIAQTTTNSPSGWQTLLRWLKAFDDAFDYDPDAGTVGHLNRKVSQLEQTIHQLETEKPRRKTMTNTPITQGAHHIGLTVPDLAQTRAFFVDALGFEQIGEVADYPAVFLTDGTTMLTLWQANDPATAIPFDRKNVIGLHHFALKVNGADVLNELHGKLKETDGVDVEFAPEPLGGGATQHMMCFIPGGIRMELIAPAA